MFITIDGKVYLDDLSMIVLVADQIREYVKCQNDENVDALKDPLVAKVDSAVIVGLFKKQWNRPQDDENVDHQELCKSVEGSLRMAAALESARRTT